MEFRNLKKQYQHNKQNIDAAIAGVLPETHFIGGAQVTELEHKLAEYVGAKHCITCGNGTDALQLALTAWNVNGRSAVFVPDFTFFASGEAVCAAGAVPVFVDVDPDTYNISANSLEEKIEKVRADGRLTPTAVVAVDLFGLPANYPRIREIADRNGLLILEDSAQGFGGSINGKKACSFGDISTTSFFPAKPLGCYGDGGAVFTDNDEWAAVISSLKLHGKGADKYDNVRIGMNSRLDTLQAAVLLAKLPVFTDEELDSSQRVAELYTGRLSGIVKTPVIPDGSYSSRAQYTIQLRDREQRDGLREFLGERGIPTMVYYPKPMHRQDAFRGLDTGDGNCPVAGKLCDIVLSLPFDPYLEPHEIAAVADAVAEFMKG